jgi:hypothetical protein
MMIVHKPKSTYVPRQLRGIFLCIKESKMTSQVFYITIALLMRSLPTGKRSRNDMRAVNGTG